MRQEGFWGEAVPEPQRALRAGKGLVPEYTINPVRQGKKEECEYRREERRRDVCG